MILPMLTSRLADLTRIVSDYGSWSVACPGRTSECLTRVQKLFQGTPETVDLDEGQSKMIQEAVSAVEAKYEIVVQQREAELAAMKRALEFAEATAALVTCDLNKEIFRNFQVIRSSPHPFDVCFRFKSEEAEIWESSTFLATKSDYFKDLFHSGSTETARVALDVESCKQATHLVQVTESSSDVYHAIFTWLRTGLVAFTPLGELTPEPKLNSKVKRVNMVSASSVFLLAHYFQLSELVEITLVWVVENLNPNNVVFELSWDWTGKPNEMKDKLLAFAVANWSEVKMAKLLTSHLKEYAEKRELSAALVEPLILGLKLE